MTIHLKSTSEQCLYEQIYEHIRDEIQAGKLSPGERLPSTRSLAENLQVARSTVEFAYDQLLSEGYIESKPYRGYFACEIDGLYGNKNTKDMTYSEENRLQWMSREKEKPMIQWDFSPNAIDMSFFPFSVWRKINKNILNDNNQDLFAQGDVVGDVDLRETIARYLYDSRGVNCKAEQIVIGAGNDYLLMLLSKILGSENNVAMDCRTYKKAGRIFQAMGYGVSAIEMDESGMRLDKLKQSDANIAYLMPTHQFPTGILMPIHRRTQLLRWASEGEERYLIEDDYDSEFRYRGKPIPSLQSSDHYGKVIYIGTFSKAIAPAIRVSFMVLPTTLMKCFYENCAFYSCTVSRIDQRILNEFIKGGYFERHLNKMRKIYKTRHDMMLQYLEPFERYFSISGENAGLHVVLTAKGPVEESVLVSLALDSKIKVYGESTYILGDQEEDRTAILLGFGGLSEEQIQEGLEQLYQAWSKALDESSYA